MSELTQCNFCSFQKIKAEAKQNYQKVSVVPNKTYELGGVDIFVHPHNLSKKKPIPKRYWKCWFMQLGERCAC